MIEEINVYSMVRTLPMLPLIVAQEVLHVLGIMLLIYRGFPDSKTQGANMGPTWVLSAPDGPHVGPMKLAIRFASLVLGQSHCWLILMSVE